MPKTAKPDLALYVWTEENRSSGYHCFYVRAVVRIRPEGKREYDGIGEYAMDGSGGAYYPGLVFQNMTFSDARAIENSGEMFYRQPYKVDLRDATRMAQTLKAVSARLDKFNEIEGRPATFGAYLNRVARAIGATWILIDEPADNVDIARRAGERHSSYTPGDAVIQIDHLTYRWKRSVDKAAEKENA
jgi:hypothetical protein